MPTYDYECETCKRAFEAEQRMSDPPLTTCTLPTPRTIEERWASFENSGGAVSWNGYPFFLHPDRCKCQDAPVPPANRHKGAETFDRDPYPHRHYPQYAGHPCARCTECEKYEPAEPDLPCGGPVRRVISGQHGFVLKGSGWFRDGY